MAGWNSLKELITTRKPKSDVLGSGLAASAARTMGTDAEYQKYVLDAQERGETPMSRADWLKSRA